MDEAPGLTGLAQNLPHHVLKEEVLDRIFFNNPNKPYPH